MRVRRLLVALLLLAAVAPAAAGAASRPNVVLILADDLTWDLVDVRFAPHVVDLQRRGTTFSRAFVADSLCCPSRASIFTGRFPHDTKVVTNLGPRGGWRKFRSEGLEQRTFAVAMQGAGYSTSLLGKYLNGYGDLFMTPQTAPVPPGWSDWHVSNITGYGEFDYVLNDNGTVRKYGGRTGRCGVTGTPNTYGVDVLGEKAQAFIDASAAGPFALEVATFAPHAPPIPAPRNACDFPGLTAPRDPSFGAPNAGAPAWLRTRAALSPAQTARLDAEYRRRAQATEAIDQLLGDVQAKLAARGLLDDTYVVFSSDNGYHLGQHGLPAGKQTAFDTDVRVPLIVAGPGVPAGRTVRSVVQNVDLHPTFVRLAGARPAADVDGRSLLALMHPGRRRPKWRTVALVEHHGASGTRDDPDYEGPNSPPGYRAIRMAGTRVRGFRRPVRGLYVEYPTTGETEFYDLRKDPYQRRNRAGHLDARQRAALHRVLTRLGDCHGARACWAAGRPR